MELRPLRQCPRCPRVHRRSQAYCTRCHAASMREWRRSHPQSDEARRRANARSYANVYLARGKLEREPCVDCGLDPEDGPVEMWHLDYDRPLDIEWVCRDCRHDRLG